MVRIILRVALLFCIWAQPWASGTFIYPPDPPKDSFQINEQSLAQGKLLLEKKEAHGRSCLDCHGPGQKKAFRRRGLYKKINKLLPQLNLCLTDPKRMAREKTYGEGDAEFKAIRLYLADKFLLVEYLK